MTYKKYIRANLELQFTTCKSCGKKIYKNHPNQIVYFCCRKCRKEFKIK